LHRDASAVEVEESRAGPEPIGACVNVSVPRDGSEGGDPSSEPPTTSVRPSIRGNEVAFTAGEQSIADATSDTSPGNGCPDHVLPKISEVDLAEGNNSEALDGDASAQSGARELPTDGTPAASRATPSSPAHSDVSNSVSDDGSPRTVRNLAITGNGDADHCTSNLNPFTQASLVTLDDAVGSNRLEQIRTERTSSAPTSELRRKAAIRTRHDKDTLLNLLEFVALTDDEGSSTCNKHLVSGSYSLMHKVKSKSAPIHEFLLLCEDNTGTHLAELQPA